MAEKTTSFTGPIVVGLNEKKGEIRLTDGKDVNEAKYLSIAAPENITSNTTLTFPNNTGTIGQVLTTDGNGDLTWSNAAGAGPGGTVGQSQVNDGAGGFAGVSEGSSGQVLTSNGAGSTPTFQAAPAGGIAAVVDDTTPQLGGSLDLNNQGINGQGTINIFGGSLLLRANAPNGTNNGPFIGTSTGSGASGFGNLALGPNAGQAFANCAGNIAVGTGTLLRTTSGGGNVGVGREVLRQNITSSSNTGIGYQALDNTTGGSNTAVGSNAGTQLTSGQNNTLLGRQAQPSSATVSNEITLGNSSVATLRCNVTSITALSDARDKKDVEDANIGLDFINDLRPVKFVWDTRDGAKKDIKEVGFIAQELDEVQQKHGVEDHLQLVLKNNPDKLEASQGKLIPILVQAIKDLKKELDELKKD